MIEKKKEIWRTMKEFNEKEREIERRERGKERERERKRERERERERDQGNTSWFVVPGRFKMMMIP